MKTRSTLAPSLRTTSLRAAILASIGASAASLAQGCDNATSSDGAGGAATTSSTSSGSTTSSKASTTGSTTSASGSTTSAASTATTDVSSSASTGSGMQNVERCFGSSAAMTCPTPDMASATFGSCTPSAEKVLTWISGPTDKNGQCCYQVDVSDPGDPGCGVPGRPLLVDAAPVRAKISRTRGPAWSRLDVAPKTEGLDRGARAELARRWAEAAGFEHASVAAFSKLALELIAKGAPRDLVAATHEAALDEIRHASIGFGFASAYAGSVVEPGAFSEALDVFFAGDLRALGAAAAREGCVNETLAALIVAAQRDAATDPAARSALAAIADDEARHAELSYKIVAWAIREGGDSVREAVRRALDEAVSEERAFIAASSAQPAADAADASLSAHGALSRQAIALEKARGLRDVVLPAIATLLA